MIAPATSPMLTFRSGPLSGESRPVRDSVRIGRSAACDVVLDDRSLSRLHCTFFVRGAGAFVEDHDSTNGTRVNGETVLVRRRLRDGDLVSIGGTEIRFGGAG